jgi:nicotinamide phosphoribosyltransferase
MNPLLQTDSYKLGHWMQYPKGTQRVYSYFESRGGAFPETVFFGLQYYLNLLSGNRWGKLRDIYEAQSFAKRHGEPFNFDGWYHIHDEHECRLPLSIKAVPEGTVVPTRNVLMTVENTCDECFWVTNYFETLLSRVWYPTTVATQSREFRRVMLEALDATGDPSTIDYKVHDFGARGVSSSETAALGAAAHLTAFNGTDTMEGIELAQEVYGPRDEMFGVSIPAYEHSTVTSWGKEHELDCYRQALKLYPKGPLSVVSDSYDILHAVNVLWGTRLREDVLKRDGVLIIRPDSGNPIEILPKVIRSLYDSFGGRENDKWSCVLDPHVRVIQGDGVTLQSMSNILRVLRTMGWSADNIAFGSGGGLLQQVNRDTCQFAFKCSAVKVNGEWQDVWKEAPGKESKRGRLCLTHDLGRGWKTYRLEAGLPGGPPQGDYNVLREVFRDGEILEQYDFPSIRQRARSGLS